MGLSDCQLSVGVAGSMIIHFGIVLALKTLFISRIFSMELPVNSMNVVKIASFLIECDNKSGFIKNTQEVNHQMIKLKEALYHYISPNLEEEVIQLPWCIIDRTEYALIHLIKCTKMVIQLLPESKKLKLQHALHLSDSLFPKLELEET
jgi:hypothetical protein